MKLLQLLIASLLFVIAGCSQPKAHKETKVYAEFNKADKMDEVEFWKIIDYSYESSAGDLEMQSNVIIKGLSQYTPSEIIEFEVIFTKKLIEANDYKIIAINHIVDSPVSDDGFLYFRCWLISLGRKNFEQTIKKPDYLAHVIQKGVVPDFESMLYISTSAYKNKTGKQVEDATFPREVAFRRGLNYETGGAKITGKDWKEEDLPKLYPKLWAKFN
ncbi:hypothetical protein ABIB62_000140 [Mucilaginibacter sp. UYP25]|uniref:DUF4240 domain-containing protein n=1 Tax=unclassified Mucilaginibacter TaxID=2617802 RepID=UPI0033976AB3